MMQDNINITYDNINIW